MAVANPKPLPRVLEQKTTLYFSRNAGEVFMRGKYLVIRAENGLEREFLLSRTRRIVLIGRAKVDTAILYRLVRCHAT